MQSIGNLIGNTYI